MGAKTLFGLDFPFYLVMCGLQRSSVTKHLRACCRSLRATYPQLCRTPPVIGLPSCNTILVLLLSPRTRHVFALPRARSRYVWSSFQHPTGALIVVQRSVLCIRRCCLMFGIQTTAHIATRCPLGLSQTHLPLILFWLRSHRRKPSNLSVYLLYAQLLGVFLLWVVSNNENQLQ